MSSPPLLGDGTGIYRVKIVGNSGAGKSTVGQALADKLEVPFVPLDTLFWEPGWKQATNAEFTAKLEEKLRNMRGGWVIDGNFDARSGNLAANASTDIIWLDPPLALYFPRLLWRTFLRLFRVAPPCSPGCPEQFTETFFSKDSIILWCLTQHTVVRRRESAQMQEIGLQVGGKMRRIGGWGGELREWWTAVCTIAPSRKTV